jgi:ATP-binding protein involved in chromosome partitioning
MALTEKQVLDALSRVIEPELHRDLVSLNMIKNLKIKQNDVAFTIELTTPACPLRDVMDKAARVELGKLPGIGKIDIAFDSNVTANARLRGALNIPVRNIIAVASGKGGVGKTTVAVNLALALAKSGARVGLLDNDVYGPNVPIMLGLPTAQVTRDGKQTIPAVDQRDGKIMPVDAFGIKVFSIGFIYPPEAPLVWRGPMLHSAIRQFLQDVEWGELDYLIIDMPPGTGDSQLSLAQVAAGVMGLIVTTPQLVSLSDALKGLAAFEQLKVPVLGVIENMGPYTDPATGAKVALFGEGGGQRLASMKDVPFLGSVPLDALIRVGGDSGKPILITDPNGPVATRFMEIARQVAARVSVVNYQNNNVIPISIIN